MPAAAPSPASSIWNSYRLFYSEFRRNFTLTGAIAPSSPALAHAITAPLSAAQRHPLRVLEVGAGTGVFTAAILRRLAPGDTLDVYEINPSFESCLQARLEAARGRGIACQLHIADIAALEPQPEYDFIISGLPLNNFSAAMVNEILRLLMGHLRPGGTFSYFEYPFLRSLKRAVVLDGLERTRLREVDAVVHGFLRSHPCRHTAVPLNLPPALAHHIRFS